MGLDFDKFMLEKIDEKLQNGKNIKWRKADIISDEWGAGFDVVLLADNILFNIVSDIDYEASQELLIKKLAQAQEARGHLFIDWLYIISREMV